MLEIIIWIFIAIAGFAVVNGLWIWLFVSTEMKRALPDTSREEAKPYFPPNWAQVPQGIQAQ